MDEIKKQCSIPHHRNLANIYCAWEEKGRIFAQMKIGLNGCLARLVSEHKKCSTLLPEKQIYSYFIDMLLVNFLKFFLYLIFFIFKGIAFLHDCQVIHSDIKPDNVFLTENDICIIGDFSNAVCLENVRVFF